MPPPFSTHHNAFLLNYIEHGRTKVLNKFSKAFALHKNGFLVSVELFVREVSAFSVEAAGIGGDGSGAGGGSQSTSFLGVLKPISFTAPQMISVPPPKGGAGGRVTSAAFGPTPGAASSTSLEGGGGGRTGNKSYLGRGGGRMMTDFCIAAGREGAQNVVAATAGCARLFGISADDLLSKVATLSAWIEDFSPVLLAKMMKSYDCLCNLNVRVCAFFHEAFGCWHQCVSLFPYSVAAPKSFCALSEAFPCPRLSPLSSRFWFKKRRSSCKSNGQSSISS